MASFQITSTGNPILPINLEVKFPLVAAVTYVYPIVSNKTGQDLILFISNYGRNEEDAIKTQTNFSIQDTNRNSVTSYEDMGDVGGGFNLYSVTIHFGIANAEIVQYSQVSTDLTGTERETFLTDYSNAVETTFKSSNSAWVCE